MSTTSSVGVTPLGNGYFIMDGHQVNLMDMMMAIAVKMKDANEAALANKVTEIEKKLAVQEAINEATSIINTALSQPGGKDGKFYQLDSEQTKRLADDLALIEDSLGPSYINMELKNYITLAAQGGSGCTFSVERDGDKLKMQLQSLQNASSTVSSQNEMDMMELNKLNSLVNSCLQLAKTFLQETQEMLKVAAR